MTFQCPFCGAAIPAEDINVSADVALCRACGSASSFAVLAQEAQINHVDPIDPTPGAWAEQTPNGFHVGASTRSWMALFLVPFTCVWAGGSVGGIYGGQLRSGHFSWAGSLFGLPFLLGSCVLIAVCAMNVAGKVDLVLVDDTLSIFAGVGPVGWTRQYRWSDFIGVREGSTNFGSGFNWKGFQTAIMLEGKRRISFGTGWTERKRYFVLRALQKALAERRLNRNSR